MTGVFEYRYEYVFQNDLQDYLSKMGQDGWELIHQQKNQTTEGWDLILKKKVLSREEWEDGSTTSHS